MGLTSWKNAPAGPVFPIRAHPRNQRLRFRDCTKRTSPRVRRGCPSFPHEASNAAFPIGDTPFPVGNAPFPVGDEPFPLGSEAFPVENEAFPARNAAFEPRSPSISTSRRPVSNAFDAAQTSDNRNAMTIQRSQDREAESKSSAQENVSGLTDNKASYASRFALHGLRMVGCGLRQEEENPSTGNGTVLLLRHGHEPHGLSRLRDGVGAFEACQELHCRVDPKEEVERGKGQQ